MPRTLGPAFAAAAGTAFGLVLVSAVQPWLHVLPPAPLAPLTLLELAAAVFVVTTLWWELVERGLGVRRRVMIVGTKDSAAKLAAELARGRSELFDVIGTVDVDAVDTLMPESRQAAEPLAAFARVLQAQRPDLVVVADDRSCGAAIGPMLDLGDASPRVVGLAGFFEDSLGSVPIGHLSPTWFMSLLHLRQRPHSRLAKRLFDVLGAALGLAVALPLIAIISLLVRRTPGPVIYRQIRVGQGGKTFEMYKFRTMTLDAEEVGSPLWACDNDPRATRVGRFLRRTHLDELPQLWNVLCGDMSLVGPRPERPDFIELLEAAVPFWGRRLLVKPGLTGWAQVQSGYASDVDGAAAKLSYDLWYLRHRSLLLDLAICMKTLGSVVVGGRGR